MRTGTTMQWFYGSCGGVLLLVANYKLMSRSLSYEKICYKLCGHKCEIMSRKKAKKNKKILLGMPTIF
jgi:hypothetical protein